MIMDSASSGSISSGGAAGGGGARGGDNDEYESHSGELMSSFLKSHDLPSPKPQQKSTSPQQPPPPPPPNFFDLSYILDSNFQQNANFHLNFGSFSSTSLASSTSQSLTVGSQSNYCNYNNINQASSSIHPMPTNEKSNNYISSECKNSTGIKNTSKKRSRASRRAPTTILTTDTINFRQMVQEFTGIPAPPFISGRGFDLFSRSGALGTSYPLRPLAQKGASSSSTPPSLLNSRTDFGLPPNLKQPQQNQTEDAFNNMQNQYSFQPLQESTISTAFNDRSHGSSSMFAPPADPDEHDDGIHNHHR